MPNTTKKQPQDFRSKLAKAKAPERVVSICLDGSLLAQIDELDATLRARAAQTMDRLSGDPEARKIAEKINALQVQMADSEQDFRLRAMTPRKKWTDFFESYPPREGVEADAAVGVDTSTFYEALVRASIVDPDLNDEDWEALQEVLTDATLSKLANAAWGLNRHDVDVPFSDLAFVTLQHSGETSKAQPAGE